MNRYILFVALLLCTLSATAQTKVYLLPALHGMHAGNIQYSYDTLQSMTKRINPDVIAVEIRPEDIAADTVYLKQNYPYEMWMMRYWQPNAVIAGFDWLGTELEAKPIPARYWQEHSRIKALQRLLAADSAYQKKLEACALYTRQRMPVLQSGSLKEIIYGNDALLVKSYYDCLTGRLRGSEYEELPLFYRQRDQKLQQNVQSILRNHSGKTVVVITGVDHYPYMMDVLKKENGVVIARL